MGFYKSHINKVSILFTLTFIVLLAACASNQTVVGSSPNQESGDIQEIVVTASKIDNSRSPSERASEERRAEREYALSQLNQRAAMINQNRSEAIEIQEEILTRPVDPTMIFKNYGVNPTVSTLEENTTTFSIDVDTASYNVAKAFLDEKRLPDPDGVRVEEFINSFDYGYLAPQEEVFSLQAESFRSEFRRGFHVLHLGVKAKDLSRVEAKLANITLLIDVSGSMDSGGRLQILKQGLNRLVGELTPEDTISIVIYNEKAKLLLEPTSLRNDKKIKRAINSLSPGGGTNIGNGIELAYRMANKSYHPDRTNRIILCSDGVANVGDVSAEAMMKNVSDAAKRGIYLNSVGVGMGNYNDVILEQLATQGQGQYAYVNSVNESKKIFSENLISGLQVVARDVRIQVEFDPLFVKSYRLLGYENRGMDNSDFDDATKDAGEVGVGHSITAIYEVKFRESSPSENFGTFRINYKDLETEDLHLFERTLPASIVTRSAHRATANTQMSYVTAAFAEKLRGSYWSRTYSYKELQDWIGRIRKDVADPEGAEELQHYIRRARRLDKRNDRFDKYIAVDHMSFDHVPVLRN